MKLVLSTPLPRLANELCDVVKLFWPVEAMAASQQSGPERLGGLPLLGIGMIEIGIAALICALWLDVPQPLVWAGAGAVLLLVGMPDCFHSLPKG